MFSGHLINSRDRGFQWRQGISSFRDDLEALTHLASKSKPKKKVVKNSGIITSLKMVFNREQRSQASSNLYNNRIQ